MLGDRRRRPGPGPARTGPLDRWDIGAPPTWGPLPLVPVDGPDGPEARRAITAVAAQLTTDARAAAELEQLLLLAQPQLVAEQPLGVAVWVPDPLSGYPAAHLVVELLLGDGTSPEEYLETVDGSPGPGQQVVRFDKQLVRLPAGDAVLLGGVGSDEGGVLEEVVEYVVFPDACADGIRLVFASTSLHLGDELAEQARLIAATLVVTGAPA